MQTLFFLLFCCAVGYVCVWVVVNESKGNKDGEWGLLAMLRTDPKAADDALDGRAQHGERPGWKP